MSTRKRMRELRKLAKEWGRVVKVSKRKSHVHLVCPRGDRPTVIASCSPSCYRGELNMIAELRRCDQPFKENDDE